MSNQKSTNKHPQYKYASTREKYCFGIGAIGKDAICNLVGSFLMLYFTDTLYLAPAFVGVLFLVARIWDAINDPVMGMICDNTHTKFGKFRIWLVIGTLLNSVAFVLLFHSFHLSGTSLYIYVSVMYILYGMTYTIMDVPYWSWLPNLTNDPHEREKVSVIPRFFASLAGFSVATFGLYIINHLNKIAGEKNLYGENSIKGLPKEFQDKYFEKMGDRFYKISDDIKRCVEFKKSNLLKDPYPTGCHLIVCRNVLIYFTEEAKKDVYEKFNKSLVTDGCLFVGNTEQIIGYRDMGYSYDQLFFYRKTN